jgi:hypothetical protein
LFIFITFKLITGKGLQLRFISYRCCVTLFVMENDFICDGEGNNHKRGYKLFCVMKFRRNVYISLCFETSTELDYQITYWHKTGLSNYLLTQNWIIKLLIATQQSIHIVPIRKPPLLTTQYWLLNTVVFVFYTSLSQHINMRKYHIRFSSHLSSVL